MKYSKFVLGIVLISALCLAGCSDGSSDSSNSDGNKGVLDLRIQNNGTIADSSRLVKEEGSSASYKVETDLVIVEAKEDGMHFTIKNPLFALEDKNFENGSNYIAVYRIEKINGIEMDTTCAVLNTWYFDPQYSEDSTKEEINFIYPLCEENEVYKFRVQIEPRRDSSIEIDRDKFYCYYLTVKAKGGIGDIDYSNLKNGEWAFASCNGENANVWIENVIPPQDTVVQDVGTYIDIFYGDKDWGKNTDWFNNYESEETIKESCSIELKHQDGRSLEDFGAKTFFAQYSFTFKVPACPEVKQWRTATLYTNLVEVN
ncbi:hypothetical protein [Treponema sp.]|uniref:hypothetical protein n=1 Tax=Treponema sp. TaxID=166 RepID=UPI003F0842B1